MAKTKLQITVVNCETGEKMVRDATTEEILQMEIDAANLETKKAEAQAKAAQRQALLDKLGITAEEAQLLLG